MRLRVENFAKVKEAEIEINGITVIAGENNTGKSTIGKIMYCLYSVFKDIDLKVVNERKRTIARALFDTLELRKKMMPYSEDDYSGEIMNIVNEIFNMNTDELDLYFEKSNIEFSEETKEELLNAIEFEENNLKSLIIKKYFTSEFHNQFLPLMNIEDKSILSLLIKDSENTIYFETKDKIVVNSELNLMKDCIYIDNPFSLNDIDDIQGKEEFDILDFIWRSSNIYTHEQFLLSRLSKSLKQNDSDLIGDDLLNKRLSKFKSMIIEVINGDFVEKENRFVFFDNVLNHELELENLSTGVKSLAIILKLLENKDVSDNSMIVLDEPEIHLHPEWQLVFAELLVLLQKEFNLNIVLTSHSPYFINAIQVYSAKHSIADKCKYYLAELDDENRACFEDVTLNVEKIYKKLAAPLQILVDEEYRLKDD